MRGLISNKGTKKGLLERCHSNSDVCKRNKKTEETHVQGKKRSCSNNVCV